jgi:hypothetical protein
LDGAASPEDAIRVKTYAAAHPEFAALLDARREGFAALPMANPQAMRARILQAAGEIQTAAAPTPPKPTRAPWWRFAWGIGLAATAAAVFVLVRPPAPGGDRIMAKGQSVVLDVFRGSAAGGSEPLISGATVAPGEVLRFRARGAEAGHALVIGVPEAGEAFAFAPVGATASMPWAKLDAKGLFPDAARLDDSRGVEWAHLVWCPAPFTLHAVTIEAPGRLAVPTGCRQTAFELIKR